LQPAAKAACAEQPPSINAAQFGEFAMKRNFLISSILGLLVAGLAACQSNEPTNQSSPDHVGIAEQRIIGAVAPAAFSVWPAGPIIFDGTIATMPLAIWAPQPIGFVAFDVPGCTGLTLSVGAFGADGAFVATDGFAPVAISAPFLTGIQAGLAAPVAPLAFTAPAVVPGAAIAPPLLTPINPAFISPFISSSAMMFTSLPAFQPLTPVIVNVGFTWPAASLSLSAVNVFAASADATAAFMSASTAATTATIQTTAAINTANTLAFSNMLFPITFMPAIGTLPATLVW
jgi:hypothetical protein